MKVVRGALVAVAVGSLALAQPSAAATRSYQSLPSSGVQQATADHAIAEISGAEDRHRRAKGAIGVIGIFVVLLAIFAAAGLFASGKDSAG